MKYLLVLLMCGSVQANGFETRVDTIHEGAIYFNQDSHRVTGKLSYPEGVTEIVGHASSEGSEEHNLRLSKYRAGAVHQLLNRPAYVSYYGEEFADPVVNKLDRKVVVTVTQTDITYNPIFGGFTYVMGPLHHLELNTLPE